MANKEKKWTTEAELDLAIAIVKSTSDGKPRYNWPAIHDLMSNAGYDFTRDAMSQHWTKSVIKKSDARNLSTTTKANGKSNGNSGTSSPAAASAGKKRQARAPKKEKVKDEKLDLRLEPGAKKRKMETIDDDDVCDKRERSVTLDAEFDA